MQLQVLASKESPLENPAFVIKKWSNKNTEKLRLEVNGENFTDKNNFKEGIETDTEGKQMLVLWLILSSEKTTSLEVKINH